MEVEEQQYILWNCVAHDAETESYAEEGDIVATVGNVIFLCQRKNDVNNIVCILMDRTAKPSLKSIRAMFQFCIWLWEEKDIRYVRVEGSLRRYRFLEKIFPPEEVIKDPEVTTRNVYYCDLERANTRLHELVKEKDE